MAEMHNQWSTEKLPEKDVDWKVRCWKMSRKNILPEGTRDLFLEECAIKRWLQRNIDDSFSKWGYEEVITPTLEFYETFNCYPENLKEEDMYKFFDNRGRILVLRPDMTIPIARLIATKLKDETLPIRLRYTSNVFRVHESFVGKRNEYTDCGVELIGIEEGKADLEILVLALESLKKLGLNDFKLEIGNIEFFNSAFRDLDINHIWNYGGHKYSATTSLISSHHFIFCSCTDSVTYSYETWDVQLDLFGGLKINSKNL